MAKTWKIGEAVDAIVNGSREDKRDIGSRYPLLTILAAQCGQPAIDLLMAVPDHISARQIEARLKGDEDGEETTQPEVEEKPAAKAAKATKPAPVADEDEEDPYAGKSAKALFDMCKAAGIEVEPKKSPETYIAALKKDAKAKAAAKAKAKAAKPAAPAEDEDWGNEEKPAAKGKAKPKADAKPADDWDL